MNEYQINLEKHYNHRAAMESGREMQNMEQNCGIEGKFFYAET